MVLSCWEDLWKSSSLFCNKFKSNISNVQFMMIMFTTMRCWTIALYNGNITEDNESQREAKVKSLWIISTTKIWATFVCTQLPSPRPSPSLRSKPQIQKWKGEFGLWDVTKSLVALHWVSQILVVYRCCPSAVCCPTPNWVLFQIFLKTDGWVSWRGAMVRGAISRFSESFL